MAKAIPLVEKILMKQFPIERLYIVTISEAVRHLHLHLIPRMKEQEVKGISLITQATQQKANVGWVSQDQYEQCILLLKTEFENISL
jgi:diadenosine tetraphosphate (Ap4A) HIT family hydrolase